MDWNLYAWLKRGKRRLSILKIILNSNKPLSVNDIKRISKIAISQSSLSIKELKEKNLIICLNPKDKIGRIYSINDKNKKLINEVINHD